MNLQLKNELPRHENTQINFSLTHPLYSNLKRAQPLNTSFSTEELSSSLVRFWCFHHPREVHYLAWTQMKEPLHHCLQPEK